MITTIIFDLDDTLYDEIDYCRSGFKAVSNSLVNLSGKVSKERIFGALWEQFDAGNRTKTFNVALEQLGVAYDDRLIADLVNVYRSHSPKITLPQESRKVLERLGDRYTLALLTDGFLPAQQLKVKALGIEKYFKCIIYTEQLGREYWKPSPAGFEKIMETLNVRPGNTAYVADNEEKDFIAPNRLGFMTVQIIRPARLHTESSEIPGAAAQCVIHKISRLPELFE